MAQWPSLLRVAEAMNALARIGAVVGVLLSTGCAGIERAPQPEALPQALPEAMPVIVEPKVAAVPPAQAKAPERTSTTNTATQPSRAPSASADPGAAKAAAAPPKLAVKPPATQSAAAPLDLKSLETRLKETQAIGVFTKLTLKNQIDELLNQFRAFYQGNLKTSLADLRRSYDMLVLKVLVLLQDADPPLASAIAASREAIWGILSNPAKFAAV
jgi:hypothetical protein